MKSALLIAASPFQLMNMKAAISYFKIINYKLYILKDSQSERHNQIINLAKHYQMKYELIDYLKEYYNPRIRFFKILIESFFKHEGHFDMIFHGDYRNFNSLLCFYKRLKPNGEICFVDDGNATINLFKGKGINWKARILYQILQLSLIIKKIPRLKYFTIYDDIKTNLFNVIPNNLSIINSSEISDNNIYIIGTNTFVYTQYLGINIRDFRDKFISLIEHIQNYNEDHKIIYIPHGRDKYDETFTLCMKYGIEYKKLDVCIESYFATKKTYPKKIYAFTSSALYNIKKMYPHSECYNLSIKGNIEEHQAIYNNINVYYEKHGILLVEMK